MKRRDFVTSVALAGGSAYAALVALGLIADPAAARTVALQLRRPPRRTRVVILGAGLGGMAAAYELSRVGYDCTILEARTRAGGRCWTIRGGDRVVDTDGYVQEAAFARDLYFNPGPSRIPQHHVTLAYCRELGVPLEVFNNANHQVFTYNENCGPFSGKRLRERTVTFDMYGYIAELLAKAIDQHALDLELSHDDRERMIGYLRDWGALDGNLQYKGSPRRGYDRQAAGAGLSPGEYETPHDLTALLQQGFRPTLEFSYDQQMTMMQPVGGIDQIARAFEKRVGRFIRYGTRVTEIRRQGPGVRIVYSDGRKERAVTGDYCIVAIPLAVLKDIPADFSPQMRQAIAAVPYAETGKIGLQFKRRFWEEDDNIYGGISATNQPITQIWYPSYGYHGRRGVLTGYYNFGKTAAGFGMLPPAERLRLALAQGGKIHPQYRECFEHGVSVYWPKVPHNLGGWASYNSDIRAQHYPRLCRPDGPFYLCGEHLSYLTGWMAGAFEAARLVVSEIDRQAVAV
jgi:monoamine oxidase